MLWRDLLRRGVVMLASAALLALGACTFTIQPEAGVGEDMAVAEFVLPDGTNCFFSDTGVTVDFDGKHANYTCTPVDATESATQTLAILDNPMIAGPTEYFVDLATIAHTDGGFELHASEVISFTAWEIVLGDGRVCLHAGFGATMGFDGARLNYTCDKGDSAADEVGLMGELTSRGGGVWLAQIDEIGRDASRFVQLSSTQVPVTKISGMEVMAGGEVEATPEVDNMRNELIGTTWQWIETEYGDGSVVAAADPSRYTLLFDQTGHVGVQFDCNSGGGPYMLDGSSLTFGALISTLMACPAGTQDNVFAKDLAEVYSYVIEDGHLYLSLKLDTGIMEFAPVEEGAETPTEEASEEADNDLAGTSWQWEQSVYEGDMIVLVNDPSRYTLTFHPDGALDVKLDCNNGRGTYIVDGSSLSFGAISSTRLGCPADSQDNVFAEDLAAVVSYAFVEGNLHLTLSTDGVMELSPAE